MIRFLAATLLAPPCVAAWAQPPQIDVPEAARADGGIVWVATENELQGEQDGKPLAIAATETMVLRSTASGWKIVHIHWSSRTRQP